MKQSFDWAERDTTRALPALDLPTLAELDGRPLLAHQRRLAVVMIGRVLLGLGVFVVAAAQRWPLLAVPALWLVYGGALTATHHLIHGSLELSPRARRWWLTVMPAIVVESGHALQATHLLHHRSDPDLPDPEGYIEQVPWRRMPFEAWRFRYRLMRWGLQHARRPGRVRAEVAWHVVAHLGAIALLPWTPVPAWYLLGIAIASAGFAVLAGKGPQTDYGRSLSTPLVRVRTRLLRPVLFSHDRHLEHHAYPKVPLPRLRHLDEALAPHLAQLDVHEVVLP